MKFECHRSGFYKPTGTGIRHLKSSGSRKIDGYCPSYLKLNIEKDGKCAVTYFEKHWGHDVELQHLFLTADQHVTNKISEVCSGKKKDQNNLLLRLKQETLDLTKMVAQQVENSMSVEEIIAAKKLLTSVLPAMAAVRDVDGPNTKCNPQDNDLKRKIEPQTRFLNFHSTKKSKTR
ncbi:hypothetical protein GE061_016644 [Apolygus lucorum]|uniref:Uncharacterized protein n=1 Tax=Apolygus lucorum TaxID=248454 RepID=A0A8S9XGS5_APOLU|nr:hypothetical protein GE061_016644 [Apolygus lucorum]